MVTGGTNANLGFTQDNPPGGSGLLVFIYGKDSPKKPRLDIKTEYQSPPGSTSIAPSADTYVHGSAANSGVNYGTSAGLLVKQTPWAEINRETYMAFDLSAYKGRKVVSASLTFYANTSDSNGSVSHAALREITSPWAEMQVTYNTKPSLGALLQTVPVDATLAARTVDVTAYISRMVTGGTNANLGFTQDNPPGGSGLLVFIYGKDSPKKPRLDIKTE
jgi:hypothetical protein